MANACSDWSTTLQKAREKWSPAQVLREPRGRPPKRAKSSRWRSQQQRAFAAGVLHSIRIYEALRPHEQEIRAMLCARNLVDEREGRKCLGVDAVGVRPTSDDASSIALAVSCMALGSRLLPDRLNFSTT